MSSARAHTRTRAARVGVAAALVVSVAALGACSNSSTDPAAPYVPSAFDKGSQVSVLLASGSDLAKPITAALEKAQFKADVQVGIDGQDQHERLATIIAAKPKVLVIDAMDADAVRDDLDKVQETGAAVIALSALPKGTKALDYFVGADPKATGALQGQALVDGVRGRVDKAAASIEVFAGSSTDAAAQQRFEAAWEPIKKAMDAHQITVASGEKDFVQAASASPKAAATRMSTLLGSYYAKSAPQGYLAPDDASALAAMAQVRATGVPSTPFATGAGSTPAGLKALMSGQLGMTTYVDPAALVQTVVTMVTELSEGKEPTLNHKDDVSNGTETVPAQLLAPVAVNRGSAKGVYSANEALKALVTS